MQTSPAANRHLVAIATFDGTGDTALLFSDDTTVISCSDESSGTPAWGCITLDRNECKNMETPLAWVENDQDREDFERIRDSELVRSGECE